ncbi:MAG TPA: type VI secretion system protein TssL, long form [Burkholderiaceae bacterium]|nr:type VI secretion system protein TssL, long form [Burkholderiaceae bacterium]
MSSPADDRTLIQDPDRTILMPSPGGQPTVVMPRPRTARPAPAKPALDLQRRVAGIDPLLDAAGELLALVPQLRATTAHDNPEGLRIQLLQRIAEFEASAAASGVHRPKISAARYLLCSFLDEVVESTPWGAGGAWRRRNLLQEFHEERSGGEKAFELLERLGEDPQANRDMLELFYVCISLGFEGRYRGKPNGRAQLEAIAERLRQIVRGEPDQAVSPRTLALRWQGVTVPGRGRLAVLPLWSVFAVAGVLMLGIVLGLSHRLDTLAQPVFRQILAIPAALRLDRSGAAAKARLAPLLQADVASNALAVRDESLRSVVTLPADTLFVPGSAEIDSRRLPLLARVAQAMKSLPGQIAVIGHTDDTPVSTLQFPSSWHLTRERARAVMNALAQQGLPAGRLRAEGRADAEPVAPNTTADGKALNRRIQIELRLPRPDE